MRPLACNPMQHCHLLASKVTKKEGCPANSGTICACHPKLDSGPPSEAEAGTVPRVGRMEGSVQFCMKEASEGGTEGWPWSGFSVLLTSS